MGLLNPPGPGDTVKIPDVGVPGKDELLDKTVEITAWEGFGVTVALILFIVLFRKAWKNSFLRGLMLFTLGMLLVLVIMK